MKRTIVKEWEIVDHGIEGAQYFQGCGTAYTMYEHVATGCGESAKEAFNDALENIACHDTDVTPIEQSEDGLKWLGEKADNANVTEYLRKAPGVEKDADGEPVRDEGCELYYYVSIRWNTEEVAS